MSFLFLDRFSVALSVVQSFKFVLLLLLSRKYLLFLFDSPVLLWSGDRRYLFKDSTVLPLVCSLIFFL